MKFRYVVINYIFISIGFAAITAIERKYYFGIIEIEWDYGTATENRLLQETTETKNTSFVKAVFRLFSDETYSEQAGHPSELGLLGPVIFAEPGDRLQVHCKNFARFDFNMHPHLVRYDSYEGPGAAANGGLYIYNWTVGETDGPLTEEEPCILGAYHSSLNSLNAEIDAGLFGPVVVCRQGMIQERITEYILKSNDLVAVAAAKVYNERDSIYAEINKASVRSQTVFPTVNGLTTKGASYRNISLFNRLTCDISSIFMPTFTLGGSTDFQVMSTSCGLMMKNGRSLMDGVSLFSGGFRVLKFETQNLIDYYVAQGDRKCYCESLDANMKINGLAIDMFPSSIEPCPVKNRMDTSSKNAVAAVVSEIYIEMVNWNYMNKRSDHLVNFKKLKFGPDSGFGLLGPTIWVANEKFFKVKFVIPENVISYLNKSSLDLKMPNIVRTLSRSEKLVDKSIEIVYTYMIKPPEIGTEFDSRCRPFIYSATKQNCTDFSPFDTGLFGPLIVCNRLEDIDNLKKSGKSFMIAPIILDESKSLLASLNKAQDSVFHTINGLTYGSADFGELSAGETAHWFLLSVPALPSRHMMFQHSVVFGDEGRRNSIYFESRNGELRLIPGSTVFLHGYGQTVVMKPCSDLGSSGQELETWSIYCQITGHLGQGMTARFSTRQKIHQTQPKPSSDNCKEFNLAVVEMDWDYKGKHSAAMAHHQHGANSPNDKKLAERRHIFKKLVYRDRTSNGPRDSSSAHLGIMGPLIMISHEKPTKITLINSSRKPVNISPGGGIISTLLEGKLSMDGSILPGDEATYLWQLPSQWQFMKVSKKADYFPQCSSALYYSTVNEIEDLYAGLVGPILICPDDKGDGVRKLFSLYMRFDESRSSLASVNNLNITVIKASYKPLVFDTVNGRLMGAVDAPGFSIEANHSVDWFMFATGDYNDVHTVHYHGSAFGYIDADTHGTPRIVDTVTVFPSQSALAVAGRMQPIPAGVWPIHCHILEHARRGMMAQYVVGGGFASNGEHHNMQHSHHDQHVHDSHDQHVHEMKMHVTEKFPDKLPFIYRYTVPVKVVDADKPRKSSHFFRLLPYFPIFALVAIIIIIKRSDVPNMGAIFRVLRLSLQRINIKYRSIEL